MVLKFKTDMGEIIVERMGAQELGALSEAQLARLLEDTQALLADIDDYQDRTRLLVELWRIAHRGDPWAAYFELHQKLDGVLDLLSRKGA